MRAYTVALWERQDLVSRLQIVPHIKERRGKMTRKELEGAFYVTAEIGLWKAELNRIKANDNDMLDIIAIETLIREKINNLHKLKLQIDKFIMSIEDSQTRMIVQMRCVRLMTWNEIADKVGGRNTEYTVKARYYRFLKSCLKCPTK